MSSPILYFRLCARSTSPLCEGPWGPCVARLCGAEERRACAPREARSSSFSSRLSERSARRARSELRDAGARPSTAGKSARSAPDRHSEAPRRGPAGLRSPAWQHNAQSQVPALATGPASEESRTVRGDTKSNRKYRHAALPDPFDPDRQPFRDRGPRDARRQRDPHPHRGHLLAAGQAVAAPLQGRRKLPRG